MSSAVPLLLLMGCPAVLLPIPEAARIDALESNIIIASRQMAARK
jgi:hypothetical protein